MSISFYEGKNSGGLAEIHLIKKSSATFNTIPALVDDLDFTDDIVTSEDWTQIEALPNSARWNESSDFEDGVEIFTYEVSFVINKDRRAITEMFKNLQPYNLLCLIKDNNGDYRLIGSDENHCFLSYSQVKERGISQPNLYNVSIVCKMSHPAVYYSGAFTSS